MTTFDFLFNFSFTRPDEADAHVYEVGYHVRAASLPEAEASLRRQQAHLTVRTVALAALFSDEGVSLAVPDLRCTACGEVVGNVAAHVECHAPRPFSIDATTDGFDVEVTGLGESVVRIQPLTDAARDWLDEHAASEPWQWLGPALCVEHRYVAALLGGLDRAGLRITAQQ